MAALAAAVLTGVAAYRMTATGPFLDQVLAASGLRDADADEDAAAFEEPARAFQAPVAALEPEDTPRTVASDLVHELALPLSVSPPAASGGLEAPAPVGDLAAGDRLSVSLSFYYCEHLDPTVSGGDGGRFCGKTRDGSQVAPGVAACAAAYLGQQFRIEGDPLGLVYRCADTGSAVGGQHRDIWFQTASAGWDWIGLVGHQSVIEIIR